MWSAENRKTVHARHTKQEHISSPWYFACLRGRSALASQKDSLPERFGERGATAFKVETGQGPVRIDQFDQTAEQIVIVPRVVGG